MIGRVSAALVRYKAADPIILTVISVLTPYAAYVAAETIGVGSILAVVACGLYSGSRDVRRMSAATRAHAWEVWSMLLFVFNGLVFVLLGVELHSVVAGVSASAASHRNSASRQRCCGRPWWCYACCGSIRARICP